MNLEVKISWQGQHFAQLDALDLKTSSQMRALSYVYSLDLGL